MKLLVLSDLHMEFAAFDFPADDYDAVVLAGDIDVGTRGIQKARMALPDAPILYVAGNHEFYHGGMPTVTEEVRRQADRSRVHFLEDNAVELGGVRVLGATLWTDFELFGRDRAETAMRTADACMNDYRIVWMDAEGRRLLPADTLALHRHSRAWLEERLAEPFAGPTVVVTHHAPSLRSLPASLKGDALNPAFASDLEALIEKHRPALWIHGHTHHSVDYRLHETRVVSNQRGYPGEKNHGFRPDFIVEV